MLTLLLSVALAADPRPVAVVATSKRPGADAYTAQMAARVQGALEREQVPGLLSLDEGAARLKAAGITEPRSCQAARGCVGKLALILGAKGVVVSVDTARAGSVLAIVLEAVSGDGPRVLASSELTLPVGKESDDAALPIVLFARKLKEVLEAEAPKEVAVAPKPGPEAKVEPDVPVKAKLEPPPPEPPLVTAPGPLSGRKVAGVVVTGGAVAAAATAVVLSIVSASAKGQFDASVSTVGGERVSSLPRSELVALEGQANGAFYGALGTGAGAVALGVAAVVLLAGGQ